MFDMKKRRIQLASSKHQQEGDREYLCCHETLPQQMLNVYGPGKWGHLNEQPFWYHLNQSLPTGAKRMTELCFNDDDHRGVGINRWLMCMKSFMEYQEMQQVKDANKRMLSQDWFENMYAEIGNILPSVQYCLVSMQPDGKRKAPGYDTLRSDLVVEKVVPRRKVCTNELSKHAKVLYAWVKSHEVSYVSTLLHWQAGSGSSYVAACHQRAMKAFLQFGNSMHDSPSGAVSLEEFQNAITALHRKPHWK